MNRTNYTPVGTPPSRQGFYEVELEDGTEVVAEWREYTKGAGKSWFRHVSDDPTAEKKPIALTGVTGYRAAPKELVTAALKREPTLDEHIQAALNSYYIHESLYKERNMDLPPPSRLIVEGDELYVGRLPNCKAVRVLDEGRTIVISYRHVDHNYGRPIDKGTVYGVWHWTTVMAKRWSTDVSRVQDSVIFDSFRTTSLESLFSKVRHGLDDNPDYQRGYVWTEDDQQRYLDSVFAGRELGRFVFVSQPFPHRDHILDGKQRLNCLWQFYTSRISWRGLYWHDLAPRDQDRIENRMVQFAELPADRMSRGMLLRVFLELNAAGVPQSAEHLANVEKLLAEEEAKDPSK